MVFQCSLQFTHCMAADNFYGAQGRLLNKGRNNCQSMYGQPTLSMSGDGCKSNIWLTGVNEGGAFAAGVWVSDLVRKVR